MGAREDLPEPDVIYISPRGKRCVLVPHNGGRPWLVFRYLDDVTLSGGGFPMTLSNFRLMRVAPVQRERGTYATAR